MRTQTSSATNGTGVISVLLIAFLGDSFVHWTSLKATDPTDSFYGESYTRSLWSGVGILAGLIAIAMLGIEIVYVAGGRRAIEERKALLISAMLGAALAVMTLVTVLNLSSPAILGVPIFYGNPRTAFAWAGLVLAAAIAAVALIRAWPELKPAASPRERPPGDPGRMPTA